ncbi:uncharacterized protein LOC125083981 [Lutra lutra]|uniref:uncharacterized protein LOC125083981 n=1 Tax=Lutra lutra TaxID=9657 RepID=UPI001FD2FF3C|nr:uncharacterized protein LOC125083981 [Lutra lutra]
MSGVSPVLLTRGTRTTCASPVRCGPVNQSSLEDASQGTSSPVLSDAPREARQAASAPSPDPLSNDPAKRGSEVRLRGPVLGDTSLASGGRCVLRQVLRARPVILTPSPRLTPWDLPGPASERRGPWASLSAFGPLRPAPSGILHARQPASCFGSSVQWGARGCSKVSCALPQGCQPGEAAQPGPASLYHMNSHRDLGRCSWFSATLAHLGAVPSLVLGHQWSLRQPHWFLERCSPSSSCAHMVQIMLGVLGAGPGQHPPQPPGALVLLYQTLTVRRKLRNGHLVHSLYPSLESPAWERRGRRGTMPPPHLLGLVNGLEVGGHHLSFQPIWGLTTSQVQPRLCPLCALLLAGRWFIDAHTHVPRMVKAEETSECPVGQRRPISHGQVTAVCCGSLSSVPSGSPKHPLSTLPSGRRSGSPRRSVQRQAGSLESGARWDKQALPAACGRKCSLHRGRGEQPGALVVAGMGSPREEGGQVLAQRKRQKV